MSVKIPTAFEAFDSELFAALGAGTELAPGLVMPQPTLGTLPLLEQIGSPFLEPGEIITMTDTLNAAFILWRRPDAVRLIAGIARGRAYLETQREWIEAHPELAEAYFGALATAGEGAVRFAEAVDQFAATLPPLPLGSIQTAICRSIADAMGGFQMIPRPAGQDTEAKKKSSTPNGLQPK
jgi:hypothetical protein